jgi:glycosyltransferase involved in cell wall biosynthesis
MSGPLVSAIVIFLDGRQFIGEAIDSILGQDYPDIEVLLVDDGSTDGATDIARGYAARFPGRVRVLEHPGHENRGMSASRNLGVRHARGEFVAFLDADDVWLPGKIGEQVAILQEHPDAAMAYGRTEIWRSWDPAQAPKKDGFHPLGVATGVVHPAPSLLANLVENHYQTPTTCNAIVRRSVYERLGGFEESFRGMYEDQAFFAKLFLEYPVYVSDRAWARYRQHADRSEGGFSYRRYFAERVALTEFIAVRTRPCWRLLDARTRRLIRRERRYARWPRLAHWWMAARKRWRALRR